MQIQKDLKTKKRFVPHSYEVEHSENFEDLIIESHKNLVKEGTVVKGTVVGIDNDTVIVDVGLKNEGRISITEFKLVIGHPIPQIGDRVDVFVERIEGRNGRTVLSREKAIREESWIILEKSHLEEKLVDGVIFGRVKGGFTVDLSGVVAFLPGSQVDIRPIKDISPLMDIVQPFKILKMDRKLGNIVVSRRAILEESRAGARDEMLSSIKEGDVLDGFVKNITDYGAFIDLGSVDGLLHVTDISWSRINHPSEVLSMGQKLKVVVTKYNEDTRRISLGMKQLDTNPWQGIKEEFPIGKKMVGKVTNVTEYGAFIELKDGIEGLVHSSEVSWIKNKQNAKKTLTIGEDLEFVILEVDEEKHRISLSVKQCQVNPWQEFADKNPVDSVIKAKIRNIADFGLFVEIGEEIDGMIHESDISWVGNSQENLKSFEKGQEIECKILSIDVEKERVSLGIKQLNEKPEGYSDIDDISKGDVIKVKVTSISEDGIEVLVGSNLVSFIKKLELSAEKSDQNPDNFKIGDEIEAKVVSVDKSSRKVSLSIKAIEVANKAKTLKEYSSSESNATLGNILGAALNQNSEDK